MSEKQGTIEGAVYQGMLVAEFPDPPTSYPIEHSASQPGSTSAALQIGHSAPHSSHPATHPSYPDLYASYRAPLPSHPAPQLSFTALRPSYPAPQVIQPAPQVIQPASQIIQPAPQLGYNDHSQVTMKPTYPYQHESNRTPSPPEIATQPINTQKPGQKSLLVDCSDIYKEKKKKIHDDHLGQDIPALTSAEILKGELERCIDGNSLNIEKAGSAILQKLINREDVSVGLNKFAEKYAGIVTGFNYPPVDDAFDAHNNATLIHGFGAKLTLLSKNQIKQAESIRKSSTHRFQMGNVRGSMQFIGKEHSIDGDNTFKKYVFNTDIFTKPKNEQPHIVLLHYLRCILKEITFHPVDIQKYVKISRKSKSTANGSRIEKTEEIPDSVYHAIFDFFLDWFNMNHPELELPWNDTFHDVIWIQNLGPKSRRAHLFAQLSDARHNFVAYTFEHQIKAALSQLRTGTVDVDKEDQPIWKMRKHC